MDKNDDIMLQAGKAALAKLPELEAEYARLDADIRRIGTKISQYKNIVISADLQLPDPNAVPQTEFAQFAAKASNSVTAQAELTTSQVEKKAPKGECMRHINETLTRELTPVNALQVAIHQKYAALYGVSTLYANLQRGQKDGRFVNEGGKWRKV